MTPYYEHAGIQIFHGDCLAVLASLPDASIQCCVTSPPYWGLRDYGVDGQLGLEETPEEYVANMVAVFREVRRVLRADGTVWLNLGDSYAVNGGARTYGSTDGGTGRGDAPGGARRAPGGLKPKDLVGIPWRVAFALQADGWYLRSDIIWHKPNPMPESVTDRPTKSHEYVFLLSKSERYYYDADAIAEPAAYGGYKDAEAYNGKNGVGEGDRWFGRGAENRNARTVWSITTQPFRDAHFAVMPQDLARRCIVAGTKPGDVVLDPFNGAGTVGAVAKENGRKAVGVELNESYIHIATKRLAQEILPL